ncbi:MAG: patatin-like phospholipase family protein, partial [Leptospiraceae bacterium]|nr:patatin-like phospholipase family protein [Leptospiraceae bacterium]
GRDRVFYIASGQQIHERAQVINQLVPEATREYFPQLIHPDQLRHKPDQTPEAARRLARWLNGTTVGVAFGGGGARVMAHLGFLEMLEEEGLEVDEVAGASGGAVVAGMFATGMSPKQIVNFFEENAIRSKKNPLVDFTIPIKAMAAGKRFERLLKRGFHRQHVYETRIPYFPVTTDMSTGREFRPRMSEIWRAAKGSAAIPGFHPIVQLGGHLLGDGGILNNVPASVVKKFGSGAVISLNITPDPAGNRVNPDRMLSALIQGVDIMLFKSVEQHLKYTDIESRPNVDGYGTADFAAGFDLLRLGREEAERHRRDVRKLKERLDSEGF